MAEILIFIGNNTHADPVKDRRGCWKRGMPVIVYDDGHVWGREESKQQWIAEGLTAANWPSQGKLVILKITGVTAAKAQSFLDPQTEDDAGTPIFDELGRPAVFRRKRWHLVFDSVPTTVRNAALTNGEVTVTVAQIRSFLLRIRDGAQYTGLD